MRPVRASAGVSGRAGPLVAAAAALLAATALLLTQAEPEGVQVVEPGGARVAQRPADEEPAGRAAALAPHQDADVEPLGEIEPGGPSLGRTSPFIVQSWDARHADQERASCELIALDAEDRPVAGATVEVWGHTEVSPRVIVLIEQLVTATDGACRVDPPRGAPHVRISHPESGCSGLVPLDRGDPGSQPRLMVVPLQPVLRTTVRVLRRDGLPAGGAVVTLVEGAAARAARDNEEIDSDAAMSVRSCLTGPWLRRGVRRDRHGAHTPRTLVADAAGRLEFDVHVGDRPELAGVRGEVLREAVPLASVASADGELVVRLADTWRLRGTCLDADGRPVPGALIAFLPDAGTDEDRHLVDGDRADYLGDAVSCTADAAGRFEFLLLAPLRGVVWTLSPAAAAGAMERAIVAEDGELAEVTLRAGVQSPRAVAAAAAAATERRERKERERASRNPEAPAPAAGDAPALPRTVPATSPTRFGSLQILVTEGGLPAPYAWVETLPADPALAVKSMRHREERSGRTDATGRIYLQHLLSGTRRIDAFRGSNSARMDITVPPGGGLDVTVALP